MYVRDKSAPRGAGELHRYFGAERWQRWRRKLCPFVVCPWMGVRLRFWRFWFCREP
jgi:hypothetical protein